MKTKNKTVEYEVQVFSENDKGWDPAETLETLGDARYALPDWKNELPGHRFRIVKVTKEVVK